VLYLPAAQADDLADLMRGKKIPFIVAHDYPDGFMVTYT
jgi:hypothetical protein